MQQPGDLSGAIALLAVSVFALASVLHSIESGKEPRRSSGRKRHEYPEAASSTSLAVTDDYKANVFEDPQQGIRATRAGFGAHNVTKAAETATADTRQNPPLLHSADANAAEEAEALSDRLVRPPQAIKGCRQLPQTSGDVGVRCRKSLLRKPSAGSPARRRINGDVPCSDPPGPALSLTMGQRGALASENSRRKLNLEDGLFQDQLADCCKIDVTRSSTTEPTMRTVERPRTMNQSSPAGQPTPTLFSQSLADPALEYSPSALGGNLGMFGSSALGQTGMLKDGNICGPVVETDPVTAGHCDGRRLEILIHNVSHKDMVLSLRRTRQPGTPVPPNGGNGVGEHVPETVLESPDTALARPKFSLFKPSSELIFAKLKEMQASGFGEPPDALCTVYRRSRHSAKLHGRGRDSLHTDESFSEDEDDTEGMDDTHADPHTNADQGTATPIREQERQHRGRAHHGNRRISVGFDLSADPIPVADLAGYRVRTGDSARLEPPKPVMFASVSDEQRYRNASEEFTTSIHKRDSRGVLLEGRADQGNERSSLRAASGGCSLRDRVNHIAEEGMAKMVDWAEEDEQGQEDSGDDSGGAAEGAEAFITGVYFPLLSVLMPKWLEQLRESEDEDASKMVLLVSGVGHPRNQRHRMEDNSTEVTAQLMDAYLQRHYPDVAVKKVHSDTNIFRYDDNIRFVKTELMPILNDQRTRMAEEHGDWQEMMHITLSFADGSPARISSINTALRHFRPSYIHIWELKTLWHEKKICEDDVEMHTFEDIDMLPPIPASEVDEQTSLVIAEMLRLKNDLERVLSGSLSGGAAVGGNTRDDLSCFWLRKTKKPVLAVLLVQKGHGSKPQLYRGTNMEVSMPTGSLCAERNVIGSALAADLSLLRKDIKAVAVLGMPRVGRTSRNGAPSSTFPPGNTSCCAGDAGPGRARLGAGGLASSLTSVYGSSVPSPSRTIVSPVGTPATRASPPRWGGMGGGNAGAVGIGGIGAAAGLNSRAFGKGRGADGGANGAATTTGGGSRADGRGDEVERLSGACKALIAAVAADGVYSPCTERPESKKPSTPRSGTACASRSEHDEDPKGNRFSPRHRATGTDELQGPSQREASGCTDRRGNPRIRSESCTDELLAAGRVPGKAFFSGGDGDKARDGSGSTPEGQKGRSVSRSQSFDGSPWTGYERRAYADDESFKRALRRAKVVRSIASPRKDGSSVGGGAGGAGSAGGGGGAGEVRVATYNGDGRSNGGGGGGSSVTRVQAEPFCENPLKPCGACMEWLKKIAEVNPDFKVITFTDTRCEGVFIEDVAQIV